MVTETKVKQGPTIAINFTEVAANLQGEKEEELYEWGKGLARQLDCLLKRGYAEGLVDNITITYPIDN